MQKSYQDKNSNLYAHKKLEYLLTGFSNTFLSLTAGKQLKWGKVKGKIGWIHGKKVKNF